MTHYARGLLAVFFVAILGCAQSEEIPNDPGPGPAGASAGEAGGGGQEATAGSSGQAGGAGGDSSPASGSAGSTGTAGSAGGAGPEAGNGGSLGAAGHGGSGPAGHGGSAGSGSAVGKGGTTGTAGSPGHGGATGLAGAGAGGRAAAAPTFTQVYTTILTTYCDGGSCHNPGTKGSVNFASQSTAYNTLKSFVVAGNGAGSKLYSLVNTGKMPDKEPKLSAANIALIKAWIDAGALNN